MMDAAEELAQAEGPVGSQPIRGRCGLRGTKWAQKASR